MTVQYIVTNLSRISYRISRIAYAILRDARYVIRWPELTAALAPLLVFWRIIFGGQVLYWGLPVLQFVPWRVLANQALGQGHLPLWTPLLGMGAPLMANYQSAVFYPPNWLALLLPPEVAISMLAVLHLSFAGVGMVRLARALGLNDFGAAIMGLSFGLSGYLTGRLWFITINNSMAWLPWILLAATPIAPESLFNNGSPTASVSEAPFRARLGTPAPTGCFRLRTLAFSIFQTGAKTLRVWRLLLLSALLALQLLAGHAQSTFYTLLLVGAWITWHSTIGRTTDDEGRKLLVIRLSSFAYNYLFFALALVLALSLAAIQLLPTFELLRESPRAAAAGYDFASTYSLWPWRLFSFLVPDLFGHPADHNYWGYATYWEDNGYLGLLPTVFALYCVYIMLRQVISKIASRLAPPKLRLTPYALLAPHSSLLLFSLLLIPASILLALGKNTPVFPFLYHYVPGFGLFQAPARMLIGYTFAFSLLAGIGAHYWRASDLKRYWSRLGIAGSLTGVILGIVGARVITHPQFVTFGSAVAWAAAFAIGLFVILLKQPKTPRLWRWVALAFVTVDLGLAAVRLNPTTDRTLYQIHPASIPESRVYQFEPDEYQVKFRNFFRFKSYDPLDPQALRNSLLPNLTALDNIASANNFDPLLPARYVTYVKEMEKHPQLLGLANVRTLVRPGGLLTPAPAGGAARYRSVTQARAVADAAAALAAITDSNFDQDTEVILEPTPAPELHGWAFDPNAVVIPYSGPAGYIVLADTFYPGWRVRVDGVEQPLLRANYLFKAVAVPAGEHEVVFEYAPFSVTLGLMVSISAAGVWAALIIKLRP